MYYQLFGSKLRKSIQVMASDLRCEEVLHILEEDENDTSREFETMMAGKLNLNEKFREIE